MPTEPDESRTDEQFHDEGGPVKSFLDHLEDLRWVLIKSLAALGIGMLICLIALWLMAWYRVVGTLWRSSVVAAILLSAALLTAHRLQSAAGVTL